MLCRAIWYSRHGLNPSFPAAARNAFIGLCFSQQPTGLDGAFGGQPTRFRNVLVRGLDVGGEDSQPVAFRFAHAASFTRRARGMFHLSNSPRTSRASRATATR